MRWLAATVGLLAASLPAFGQHWGNVQAGYDGKATVRFENGGQVEREDILGRIGYYSFLDMNGKDGGRNKQLIPSEMYGEARAFIDVARSDAGKVSFLYELSGVPGQQATHRFGGAFTAFKGMDFTQVRITGGNAGEQVGLYTEKKLGRFVPNVLLEYNGLEGGKPQVYSEFGARFSLTKHVALYGRTRNAGDLGSLVNGNVTFGLYGSW